MPFLIFSSFPPIPDDVPADLRDNFDLMWKVMTAFTLVMVLAFTVLFGWIVKRLMSHEVKRECLAL